MSGLNANKVKSTSKKDFVEQPPTKIGNHAARVVQVLDLGLQNQRPYKGEDKPPKHCIQITYELSHEFMVDKDGAALEDKPKWISEDFPFLSLKAELAKSTKRYHAIDAEGQCGGDFTKLVGMPCTVGLVHNAGKGQYADRIFENVGTVTAPGGFPGYVQPELVNAPKVFILDEPDMEVFLSLPEFLQEKIKGNLEFKGSLLDKALNGEEEPSNEKEDKPAEEECY